MSSYGDKGCLGQIQVSTNIDESEELRPVFVRGSEFGYRWCSLYGGQIAVMIFTWLRRLGTSNKGVGVI